MWPQYKTWICYGANCVEKLSIDNTNIKAVTIETLLALCTVQIVLVLNGKYNAMNFSTEIITSNAEE